jgi:putative transcriptional regulator
MSKQIQEQVSNTVSSLRHKRELTQDELATLVGVTRQTVIAIEKGNYVPSVLLALKLSKVFKKPVEEVFRLESK